MDTKSTRASRYQPHQPQVLTIPQLGPNQSINITKGANCTPDRKSQHANNHEMNTKSTRTSKTHPNWPQVLTIPQIGPNQAINITQGAKCTLDRKSQHANNHEMNTKSTRT